MLCYETNLELDIARDNIEFLKKKSGAERLKFLADYFLLSYDEAGYAIKSFKNDAFIVLFNVIEKRGDINALAYSHENKTAIFPSFVSIREMDLARFKRYEEEIKSLEDRLKTLENALIDVSDKIFTNWRTGLFDTSGDGVNDTVEA